jgi:GNAT superfamily N-acetyltransferase
VTFPIFPFADLSLARRLERAEGRSSARSIDARARLAPESGACWIEVAGALAMFDTPSSPITQTFGLGLFQTPTADDLAVIEAFYRDRGAPAFHEVSPLADVALATQLVDRGYQPIEFTSVLYRSIAGLKPRATTDPAAPDVSGSVAQGFSPAVRLIEPGEEELYARTAAEGWREFGFGDFMLEMGRVYANTDGLRLFLAEIDGVPIAAGALSLWEGVAHLAGASTIPDGRRRGAQLALLDARLQYAASHGCDLALMGAEPGSGSQRNAERHGFRIAYTRVKWKR